MLHCVAYHSGCKSKYSYPNDVVSFILYLKYQKKFEQYFTFAALQPEYNRWSTS